jgi:hypothetical protein
VDAGGEAEMLDPLAATEGVHSVERPIHVHDLVRTARRTDGRDRPEECLVRPTVLDRLPVVHLEIRQRREQQRRRRDGDG